MLENKNLKFKSLPMQDSFFLCSEHACYVCSSSQPNSCLLREDISNVILLITEIFLSKMNVLMIFQCFLVFYGVLKPRNVPDAIEILVWKLLFYAYRRKYPRGLGN